MELKRWQRAGRKGFRFRGGMTLFEILAAVAVLGVLLVACAQMLAVMTVQQQANRNRRTALQMAQNAMERTFTLPWDQSGTEETKKIAAKIAGQGMVRDARVEISVDSTPARRDEQIVRIAVRWREGAGEAERVERLTAWRYRTEPSAKAAAPLPELQPEAARP